jgi:hypothetical protein
MDAPPVAKVRWTPASPLVIEERLKFPGLVLDYAVGVIQPEAIDGDTYAVDEWDGDKQQRRMRRTFLYRLKEFRYTYSHPEGNADKYGCSAYAWFAYSGDWIYAAEASQRNAFVPYAMPDWLKTLSRTANGAGSHHNYSYHTMYNCCVIRYGIHTAWTFGTDPWHPEDCYVTDFLIGNGAVHVALSNGTGAIFKFYPEQGSMLTWRGKDWRMIAHAEEPFFHLSFRVIDPNRVNAQRDAKTPHRLPASVRQEQCLVPLHMTTEEGMAVLQGRRPGPIVAEPEVKQAAAKKAKK